MRETFLRAARGEAVDEVPVWFMRQAGRSLPEYRSMRGIGSILDAIQQPDLVTEITLQPVRRHGVDAAVLFSDIMVPLFATGVGVDIAPGLGPVVAEPIRSSTDLQRLRPLEPSEDIPYVIEAVTSLVAALDVPLIGFSGAPFTLASYLIEGGPSKNYEHTKIMMLSNEALWHQIMERLTETAISFLRAQVLAGASAVQLFDSWAGALSPEQYRRYARPYSERVFSSLSDLGVPRVHFGVGTVGLVDQMSQMDIEVMGLDWRTPIDSALSVFSDPRAIQGNLDPVACLSTVEVVEEEARSVLASSSNARNGYIFNLGHGVLPQTDPAILTHLVEYVHRHGQKIRAAADASDHRSTSS